MKYLKSLLKERERYRKGGEYKKADEIRDDIQRQGFIINDKKRGTELYYEDKGIIQFILEI